MTTVRNLPSKGFEHVVVATDFTPGGTRAVDRAARLPLARGARVVVLHVLPPGIPAGMRRVAWNQAERRLDRIVAGARERALAAGSEEVTIAPGVATGHAHVEIVRRAHATSAELIVLGRHSKRPVRDVFLGSTAHRVARTAQVPVLLVNEAAERPWRRPLAALDMETTSRATLDLLRRVLGRGGLPVGVVHAFDAPYEALRFPGVFPGDLAGWGRKAEEAAEARVAEFVRANSHLDVALDVAVRAGPAAAAILKEAARRRTDLLAIGTHARLGVERVLLGSVAERVISSAACDLLVVPAVRRGR